jgi:hypothetical protein
MNALSPVASRSMPTSASAGRRPGLKQLKSNVSVVLTMLSSVRCGPAEVESQLERKRRGSLSTSSRSC